MTKKNCGIEVLITMQSFEGAGGHKSFPDLNMAGMVYIEQGSKPGQGSMGPRKFSVDTANDLLIEKAIRLDGTHIFDIKYYLFEKAESSQEHDYPRLAIGTVYNSKK